LNSNNVGITIAGNILVDLVKTIDCYPKIGMLSHITKVGRAVGGCVSNTIIDIAKIDSNVPLTALGRVGNDEYGAYSISMMKKYGINTDGISISDTQPTSFSDVMSLPSGERTFFHARGSNAEFGPEDIDLSSLNCKIFHIGYIFLLDRFDDLDEEYGTVMARFLAKVQERGISTSIDVVSDSSADYHKQIVPVLKYCNYVIINEIECCTIWHLNPYDESGKLQLPILKEAMLKTAACGVKDKIIVHCKELSVCLDIKTETFTVVPSLKIPKEEIRGSVGAGDAFCAGSLYGLHNNFSDQEILEFSSAAAACNLFAENSIDGMLSKEEILKLPEKYGRLSI